MLGKAMKPFTWIMIFVLLFQWSGLAAAAVARPEVHANQAQVEEAVAKLERLFDALEEAAKEIPRDTFDPQAIVDKVGKDPIALFEWVRDNTYLAPYRGTLRGPIGVLMDRVGNSLDRALLLDKLLRLSDYNVRLARCALTEAQAQKIYQQSLLVADHPNAISTEEGTWEKELRDVLKRNGLDVERFNDWSNHIHVEARRYLSVVQAQVAEQANRMIGILEKSDPSLMHAKNRDTRRYANRLTDHWWNEIKLDNQWVSLDTSASNIVSKYACQEKQVHVSPEDISESLFHRVTIKIIVEYLKSGELHEETLLQHRVFPSRDQAIPISMIHEPLSWPEKPSA